MTFSVKLVDAQFPPYAQVIPQNSEQKVRVPRAAFADALRAVSIAASERTGGVKLTLAKGTMRITSESPESGDGFDEVPIDYDGPEHDDRLQREVLPRRARGARRRRGRPRLRAESSIRRCSVRRATGSFSRSSCRCASERAPCSARDGSLSVRAFRNLERRSISASSPRFNVVSGDNGQGKTNLLEAIYVAGDVAELPDVRSRASSFATAETSRASARAFVEEEERREQSVGLKRGRAARADRRQAARRRSRPTPSERRWSCFTRERSRSPWAEAAERRRLLDRLALYARSGSLDDIGSLPARDA